MSYPYAAQHVSSGPDDVDVTPDRLHPSFHGSFDWHSSAHMQWSGLRLLQLAGNQLTPATREALTRMLADRWDPAKIQAEAAYLREHPSFERPYGWAWAATIAADAGSEWGSATRPLAEAVFDLVTEWLPRLAYPVRSGEHPNTAFGLALLYDAAGRLRRTDVQELIASSARAWFAEDKDYPAAWEPGGSDFLSAALTEADLMRRVLADNEFRGWLGAFLPGLGGAGDTLLSLPEVRDPSDGKGAHLLGLALYRAAALRRLAPYLDDGAQRRIAEATARNVAAVEEQIVTGGFMATHWLVSFALLAVTADEDTARDGN
ncbi:DUF2891 family protein [Calidifontibacter sp. DB0510]|uniref:DUF2891 family protein n=2 Tax=Metallococcus carri TaxID=1656884 RepID=A0A967B1L8_9MICO|nr:DUF2891 family protein [Metallococcus carri]NOP35958.1 DUF2891 family protein [Calidifontibacter sp. DB2511S]